MKAHGQLNESADLAVKGEGQIAPTLGNWLDECADESDELPAWLTDIE